MSTPYDPLRHDVPLPFTGTYYALGFRIDVASNSPVILQAAEDSWGQYAPEFDAAPVQLHIIVTPGGTQSPEPLVRTQRHLFSIMGDRDNFGSYDARTRFGYCFVSEATAAGRPWFRYHFLETMAYMLLAQESVMPVHAACIAHNGVAVLLYGLSGAGKSTLAWACARAGWTYLTDDGVWLLPNAEDGAVLSRSRQCRFRPNAVRHFPELERFLAHSRPDGKVSVDVPLDAFPQIRTASRGRVGAVIILNRQAGATAQLTSAPAADVAALLLGDMPSYGEEVRGRYRAVVGRLLQAPTFRLTYEGLAEAVRVLTDLAAGLGLSKQF